VLPSATTAYGTPLELQELGRAAALSRAPAVEAAFTEALGRRDPALADAFDEAWAFAAPADGRAEALAALSRSRAARGDVEGQLVLALQPGGDVGSEAFSGLLLRAGLPALLAEQIALRARDAAGDERGRLLVERMRVLAGPLSDSAAAARASADVLAQAPAEPEALSRLDAYLASDQAGPGALAALVDRVARAEGPLGPLADLVAAAGARTQNPGLEVVGLRAALLNGDSPKLRERLASAEAACHARLAPPSGPVTPEWRRDRIRVLGALAERRDEWGREVDAYLRDCPWSADVVEFAVERALAAGEGEQALLWARAGLDRALGKAQRSVARRLVLRALLATGGAGAAPQDLGPDAADASDVANAPRPPALARARLSDDRTRLEDVRVIFSQRPKVASRLHFGCRIVEAMKGGRPDGTLFLALGERFSRMQDAQTLDNHHGKVVRVGKDGRVPPDNPFVGRPGALPEIWSYGHRNPQGAALHPSTRELWQSEHGPQGGDEINISRSGLNYGWPNVSYGCNYGDSYPGTDNTSCRIGGGTHKPTYVEPLTYWVPTSQAPSGLAFYTGTLLSEWQGNLFMGALAGTGVWRLTLGGNTITAREKLDFSELATRIRDIRQGPDGALYALTDGSGGRIVRIAR